PGSGEKRNGGDPSQGNAADLAATEPPAPEAPDRGDDHPRRAALKQRLKYREGCEVVDPVARGNVRGQVGQRVRESDQRLGNAKAKTRSHAKHESIYRLGKVGAIRQEESGDGF